LPPWPRERSIGFPGLGDCVRRDTSQHHNTHIIESREVRYPWHPWYGQRVSIYARFVKGGVASFRCGLAESAGGRSTHLPQWMFDAVACCDSRLMPTPVVSCEALAALQELITRGREAQTTAFVEAGHLDCPSRKLVVLDIVDFVAPGRQGWVVVRDELTLGARLCRP
jgi:hypothetical protein